MNKKCTAFVFITLLTNSFSVLSTQEEVQQPSIVATAVRAARISARTRIQPPHNPLSINNKKPTSPVGYSKNRN